MTQPASFTNGAHSDFNWAAIECEPITPEQLAARATADAAWKFIDILHTLVLAKTGFGTYPDGRVVAARWCVVRLLLRYDNERSLHSHAAEIGVTPACLSQIGKEFAAVLQVSAPWQRSAETRTTYAERARGVHAGTWVVSEHTRRKQLRKQQREAQMAAQTNT